MIKTKVNGVPKLVPSSWDEVTFRQFLALLKAREDKSTDIIKVFLGEDIRGAKIEGLEFLLTKMDYLKKVPPLEETPTKIGPFTFPKDIGFQTIEQFEDTKTEINRVSQSEDVHEKTKSMALYAAIYLTEPYDSDKAKELAETFMDYPCMEVMAAGSFFQAKCWSITSGLPMSYLRQNTLLKKKKPGLNRLTRRLGSMLYWITSPGMWGKTTKAF